MASRLIIVPSNLNHHPVFGYPEFVSHVQALPYLLYIDYDLGIWSIAYGETIGRGPWRNHKRKYLSSHHPLYQSSNETTLYMGYRISCMV